MMGIIVLMLGFIGFLAYLGLKIDEEHSLVKWFLILVSFLGFLLLTASARIINPYSELNTVLDTAYYIAIVVMVVVFFYAIFYVAYIILVNAGKLVLKEENGKTKVKWARRG